MFKVELIRIIFMKFIIGTKKEMTQVWKDGEVIAVTRVKAGPCVVTQIKNNEKDRYNAVQISFGERAKKNIKKPQLGHLKKSKIKNSKFKINSRYLREFRLDKDNFNIKIGNIIDVSTFELGDEIKVSGTSKGKGFQGVVKRHGFKGTKKTHGNKDQLRMPGSIGATGPAHVFKGTKMGGRMGGQKVTISGLEIININKENNELFISGAIPGARNGLIFIKGEGELRMVENKNEELKNKKLMDKKEVKDGDKNVENKNKEENKE